MAIFEMFVDEVNANIFGKQLAHLDSLHRIWGSGRLMSTWGPFKISKDLVNWEEINKCVKVAKIEVLPYTKTG